VALLRNYGVVVDMKSPIPEMSRNPKDHRSLQAVTYE
jgi:hypothetical protein